MRCDQHFRPDGRWLAYQSNETGKDEVYVRPFPGPGTRWQISTRGGRSPIWSHNGHELFFFDLGRRIVVASYTAKADSFVAKPRVWSEQPLPERTASPDGYFDLAPDGKRFAIVLDAGPTDDAPASSFPNLASAIRSRSGTCSHTWKRAIGGAYSTASPL